MRDPLAPGPQATTAQLSCAHFSDRQMGSSACHSLCRKAQGGGKEMLIFIDLAMAPLMTEVRIQPGSARGGL